MGTARFSNRQAAHQIGFISTIPLRSANGNIRLQLASNPLRGCGTETEYTLENFKVNFFFQKTKTHLLKLLYISSGLKRSPFDTVEEHRALRVIGQILLLD